MARNENPPFPLGSTFFGGDTAVIDVAVGAQIEGQEYEFEDVDLSNDTIGSAASRSNRRRTMRAVRNMNATKLNAKEVAKLKLDGTAPQDKVARVDGLTGSYADKGYPVDEFLGSAGCLQYDICWVCVDGLAKVTTDTGGDTNFAIGALIAPGATTPGRVIEGDGTVTGNNIFLLQRNAIGIACEAKNGTTLDVVVDVGGHQR